MVLHRVLPVGFVEPCIPTLAATPSAAPVEEMLVANGIESAA
jgi:hypothetical protein